MEETKSIRQEVNEIKDELHKKKTKKFRFPSKAKVKGTKLKKGWIGVLKVEENQNGEFTKTQIDGSVFDFNHNNYHATDGSEIVWINGKYPLIIQPTWKKNPIKIRNEEEKNETYGQRYIQAKMLKDTIKVKDKAGGMKGVLVIVGVLVVGYVLGKYVFKLF